VSTVKQVAGHDPGGLLAQERPPGAACTPRRRVEPVAAQRRADRGRRDPYAEAQQLALDALVAPDGVLLGQPDDQALDVLVQWWPAGLAVRGGPGVGDQPPMPAQQRLGLDEEARPAGSRQDAADRSEQRPVGGLQPGSWGLAAEDGELVAQHQDLEVLGSVTAGEQHEQLDGATQRQVGKSRQHKSDLCGGWQKRHPTDPWSTRTCSSQPTSEFAYPTRSTAIPTRPPAGPAGPCWPGSPRLPHPATAGAAACPAAACQGDDRDGHAVGDQHPERGSSAGSARPASPGRSAPLSGADSGNPASAQSPIPLGHQLRECPLIRPSYL
jgi:hypothetical protein